MMSDQSLREALEALIQKSEVEANGVDTAWATVPVRQLRELLASNPAEPDPVPDLAAALRATVDEAKARRLGVEITDEAVDEDLSSVVHWDPFESCPGFGREQMRAAYRAGYEAAARPFMTSRPALDRKTVEAALREAAEADGWSVQNGAYPVLTDAVMALTVPVPTQEAAEPVLEVAPPGCHCGSRNRWHLDEDCPAYGKQGRETLMRQQVEEIIATKVMRYESAADVRLVEDGDVEALDAGTAAVLALLNGSAK